MAIFKKENCLYKYERYKRDRENKHRIKQKTTSVKPPHKHFRDIREKTNTKNKAET